MRILTILTFLTSIGASAKSLAASDVEGVLVRYRQASAVKAKVTKTVVQETMGTSNESRGDFYFSRGKLRMDFTEPEKTSVVYDGKNLWLESRLDDRNIQVTKMRTVDLKKSKSILTALFEKKDVLRNFKLVNAEQKDSVKIYRFEPKKNRDDNEIQSLEIALHKKDIERIAYKDQLENSVSFDFKAVERGKVAADKFSYKIPRHAQVTEI